MVQPGGDQVLQDGQGQLVCRTQQHNTRAYSAHTAQQRWHTFAHIGCAGCNDGLYDAAVTAVAPGSDLLGPSLQDDPLLVHAERPTPVIFSEGDCVPAGVFQGLLHVLMHSQSKGIQAAVAAEYVLSTQRLQPVHQH